MAYMFQIVGRQPPAAVNDEEERERALSRGKTQLSELQSILAVLNALSTRRWNSRKNVTHSL
jgi:hypothetical protein